MNTENLSKLADEIESYHWDVGDREKAKEFAARLRGEAVPEGQAVDDTVFVMGNVAFGDDYFRQMLVEGVLFLVPVESQDKARHILAAKKRRPQPAAPAPVAGEAVRALLPWPEPRGDVAEGGLDYTGEEMEEYALANIAALAQDRASQAGAPDAEEPNHER